MENSTKRKRPGQRVAQSVDGEEVMKEKLFHVVLDDDEQSVLIRCLNDERNLLMQEGHNTDALDDLIVKVGLAKQRRYKVIERAGSKDAR